MNEFEQHESTWNDRLQDLLDGDVGSGERAEIESHLASCARCRAQYAQLKRLDAKLTAKLDAPMLDASFERQVLARIAALDAHAREHARVQADRELQENLRSLSRSWRRVLAFLIGGAIAGIALAFALTTWADAAGMSEKLLGAASGLGLGHADSLHALMIALVGACIGGGISKWLATALE
jgi:anti-sigma factor RsiW